MKNSLNNELIEAIKEHLMEDVNLVELLMEKLSIGKEAAYRRLRGEVPFTFYEAVIMANTMGLSLDQIAGMTLSTDAMFNINLDKITSEDDYFYIVFSRYFDVLRYLTDESDAELFIASGILPFPFYTSHAHLMKFQYVRWMHQHGKLERGKRMKDIEFSKNLSQILKKLPELSECMPMTHLILDTKIFADLTEHIRCYADLGILSEEDVNELKEELLTFLKTLEQIALEGAFSTGNKVDLYLSNMPFDTTYLYVEKKDFNISFLFLYAIDYIATQNPLVCKMHKEWIQSLKRYATLISQCGEVQRNVYFNAQRKLILSL
ncbi:hypothetical protein [Parabacteroides sp. PF5-9]|uniref:hypothetical protein n=1 Tax=Parabacteroides sp. PF5-9 TaxID=1742404 RepID=UPI0024741C79|nr:hypothetical protein [Parabacteroides sp. PF5-9]MDH6357391.1 hypothetical protein [Parabacteroides sp. PF5-9]